jgi:hypothetical protein
MRVFAPSPFRYPPLTGKDYPYGFQDIGDDTLARALIAASLVLDGTVQGAPGGAAPGGGAGPQPTTVALSADYTLTAADDGKIFVAQAGLTLTLTVPTGLSWVTGVVIKPANTGSVTLHPTGGAMVNGSTSDVAINIITNPVPAALVATAVTDNYGLTVAGSSFAALTGAATDNADLASRLALLMALPPGGNKQSAAYTLAATDNGGFVWLAAQTADKAFSIPNTLATGAPWWCVVGYLNNTAATGRLKLQTAGGSVLNGTLNASTGALAGGPIFMGTAGSNNIAAALIVSEGSVPGGAFMVIPLCGVFAAS